MPGVAATSPISTPNRRREERLKTGVQGKYADRFQKGTKLVLPGEEIGQAFPTDQAVTEALRLVIQLKKLPKAER